MSDFLKSIGTTRLITGIAVLSILGGAFTMAMFRLADKDMTVLFADLDLQDAARITDDLRSSNTPYEQRDSGRTLLVPADQVLELRMRFAAEGLPARGPAGYELLDNQSALGTTSFLQNVNYVRALEGELSRTIAALESVRGARVFLNLPKRELFSRETKPATASIQLETTHGTMTRQQVRAIQFLVASAVQGLAPQRVSVIDEQGNVLASGQAEDGAAAAGSLDERRAGLEGRLQTEIEEILTRIVGPNNARVRVTAEMNYNRVVEERRTWDPNAQVVASTRTVEQSNNARDATNAQTVSVANNLPDGGTDTGDAGTSVSAENRLEETVNYENSLIKRTEVQEAGRLERLSVAVVVNERMTPDAEGNPVYAARGEEELKSIETLVKAAVGFDENRGDQVQVISTRFAEPPVLDPIEDEPGMMASLDITRIIEAVALVVLGLIFIFALQPLIKRLMAPREAIPAAGDALAAPGALPQLTGPAATPDGVESGAQGALSADGQAALPAPGASAAGDAIDIAQIQGQVKESSIKKVGEIVTAHPEESMSILRSWLHESA